MDIYEQKNHSKLCNFFVHEYFLISCYMSYLFCDNRKRISLL